jgi:hypothetical protein
MDKNTPRPQDTTVRIIEEIQGYPYKQGQELTRVFPFRTSGVKGIAVCRDAKGVYHLVPEAWLTEVGVCPHCGERLS